MTIVDWGESDTMLLSNRCMETPKLL